ncbi:MAG: DUF2442 domain-containing protein [Leptolyngbyaceae cyanobacterium bins.302]|nr:DUF2442 domain-containing protein [Leptolyngbyaceae cyanobacterium bins.302]
MDKGQLNQPNLQSQLDEARERTMVLNATEPRAESAYYDRVSGRIVIHLQHGAIFSFPAEVGQGLAGASPEDLAEVEVTPSGIGLHWEKLDADLSVPALVNGIYGNKTWMATLNDRRAVKP